jgi:hypothetical protein
MGCPKLAFKLWGPEIVAASLSVRAAVAGGEFRKHVNNILAGVGFKSQLHRRTAARAWDGGG